jgi:capsule biosynthesis phosphatase
MKIIIFDIDNTIALTSGIKYHLSKPIKSKIKKINQLYESGYIIKIFTARYMGKHSGNVKLIKKKYYKKTFNQIKSWGLKFHELVIGKPVFDIFVDDKAYNNKDKKLKEIFKRLLTK